MSFSIGPFPNGLPVDPYHSLLGSSVSPTKILLGYLGSFRLPLLSTSSKLSVGPLVMLEFSEMNWQTRLPKLEQQSPLLLFPASWFRLLQRLDTLATLCGDKLFLTTPSPARFLLFPRRNWPFLILSIVNCLDFADTVTAFFSPLTFGGYK